MKNISIFGVLALVALFFSAAVTVHGEPVDVETSDENIDTTDSDVFYSVQVASFKTESDAKTERDMLMEYGKESFIIKSESKNSGDIWYKVYVGRFSDKEQAEKKRPQLVKDGYKDCVVKKISQKLYQELYVP